METIRTRVSAKDVYVKHFINTVIKQMAAASGGFFSSCAAFDGLCPFGTAFAASIVPEYIPSAILGAAAGSFYMYGMNVLTLRYIASVAVAGILSFIFKRNLKRKYHLYFSTFAAFVSLFSTGLVLSLSVTISADEFILYATEGCVGALTAWFFDRFINISPGKRSIMRLSASETASVLIVFSIFLVALSCFGFYIFMPDVIAGVYVVLLAAVYGADRFGALFGITAGAVLGLAEKSGFLTGGISLAGLLCGFFGRSNRFFSCIILIICVSITAFATDDWMSAVNVLYNIGIAAALFIVTPKRITNIYKRIFAFSSDSAFLMGQRGVLRSRLVTAADGMNDVTVSVKAVAGVYRRRATPKEERVYDNVAKKICSNCEMFNQCCNLNYNETTGWFSVIADALKRGSEPQIRELPGGFIRTCRKTDKIIQELSYEIECYRSAMRECAKTGETVNIVSDQFVSVAQLLKSFSETMDTGEEYDATKTGIVYDVLTDSMKLDINSCGVFRNENRRYFCEISINNEKNNDYSGIVSAVSEALGIMFEDAVIRKLSDDTVNVCFCEKTRYEVESGNSQMSSGGCKWCGDTYDSFYDGKGYFYMILSDGMGTGQKAAADSVLCCSLASLLLRSGYPIDCILKMINSAMLVRSGEESLATLDIAVMNLYTGDVEFYKAGAASSVAMRKFRILKIEKPSLPVGILGDVKFERIVLSLHDSDVLVLMSDGVSDEAIGVWKEILKDAADYDGKELAQKLAKTAQMNSGTETADDITVMTAVIRAKQ